MGKWAIPMFLSDGMLKNTNQKSSLRQGTKASKILQRCKELLQNSLTKKLADPLSSNTKKQGLLTPNRYLSRQNESFGSNDGLFVFFHQNNFKIFSTYTGATIIALSFRSYRFLFLFISGYIEVSLLYYIPLTCIPPPPFPPPFDPTFIKREREAETQQYIWGLPTLM